MQPKETNEALAARAKAGDAEVLGALWNQNRGILYELLRGLVSNPRNSTRMAEVGVTFEDLMQESYFAVVFAAQKYDPARGTLFVSFLQYAVKLMFFHTIGMRTARQRREPLCKADSLDRPLTSGPGFDLDNLTLADAIPDDAAAQQMAEVDECIFTEQLHAALDACLEKVPERYAHVVRARRYDGKRLHEIGAEMGVSKSRAQQVESEGLRRLRGMRQLRQFREEIIAKHALRDTGFSAWEAYGSAPERTVEELERRGVL